jgi:signal transduction histidine kinase/HPt (histidine-containing phosphotransfer) domain-containing protein
MNEAKVVVTDDWTRNWQARIAIKITAMFLWVIILGGFSTVIFFTSDLETHIEKDLMRDFDALSFNLQNLLNDRQSLREPQLRERIQSLIETSLSDTRREIVDHKGILGVRFTSDSASIEIGQSGSGLQSSERRFTVASTGTGGSGEAVLEAFFLPSKKSTEQTRQHLILTVCAILLLFGMLLSLTIQNVLAKPFQVLMDAIQDVSNGDLDLRLDVSREDEFGHLSRFFNQMLDRVKSQQQKLTAANRELKNEVLVRKQAEQQLMAHRDQLEQIVEERTRDLAVARDQALEASHTKSAFIANMSHEIRTPLTPIIGFAEALLQGDWSRKEREQSLRTIIRNGRHLADIINEILDLSKIEANCLEIEKIPVDLFATLSDVSSLAQVIAREKGLEFDLRYDFPIPRTIISDPTRIKQILMNLVTNAVKFTEKGYVRVDVGFDAQQKRLVMSVSDSGVGIAREKVGRLFQAFSQADSSTTRKYGGTGLGLYISKRLAEMLGGDITLESVEGVGTRFITSVAVGNTATLEFAERMPAPEDNDLRDLERLSSVRVSGKVLLVEDSPDIQRLMIYYLSRAGVRVTAVENGKLAVEAVLQSDYDLVLMDMQMPVMGGEEAVGLLRASGCATPVIALTANAMKEDRERYREIGCDGFLSKPVDQDALYRELDRFLGDDPKDADSKVRTGEEVDGFDGIVAEFVAGLADYAARIETALAAGQDDTVRELAHQLKGMGGSFGYPDITAEAGRLEAAIKERAAGDIADRGASLLDLLHKHAAAGACVEAG